jgi:hypothetical protein
VTYITPFISLAGTYTQLADATGEEFEVYILEDGPTKMTLKVIESGDVLHVDKFVQ